MFEFVFLCDLIYVRLKLWWICEQLMCQPMVNCNAFVKFFMHLIGSFYRNIFVYLIMCPTMYCYV
jgi:hypothetical protein